MSDPFAADLNDPRRVQRLASDTAHSVWVAASAGSGKTKVLTDRILNLLLDRVAPERLLCLTFTKAAAAEMSVRLSNDLSSWAVITDTELRAKLDDLRGRTATLDEVSEARRLFAKVLDAPGGLKISTIHAFCQSLLRRFPIEAGVSPHFDLADDRTTIELLTDARLTVLAHARHGDDEDLAEALSVITRTLTDQGFEDILKAAVTDRGKLDAARTQAGGTNALIAEMYRRVGVDPSESDDDFVLAASQEDAFDGPALRVAIQVLEGGGKEDNGRASGMSSWLGEGEAVLRAELWSVWRKQFLTDQGTIRARLATKKIAEASPQTLEALVTEAERVQAIEARRRAIALAHRTAALIRIATAVLSRYTGEKRRRGLLDYDDLVRKAGELLGRGGVADWVLFKLDGGLDHILIDEAQDTAPPQWAVIRALAEEFFTGDSAHEDRSPEIERTVFAVGDIKQSIYSFQGADPAGFTASRAAFASKAEDAQRTFKSIPMDVSFRSTDAVLGAVDAVFNRDPGRIGVAEPDPIPGDRGGRGWQSIAHFPFREGMSGRVEVWPLVGSVETEELGGWTPPTTRRSGDDPAARLARVLADRVESWIGHDTLPARGRTIRAGDIMVLVRRRDRLVGELVRALKQKGVPVAGVDRLVLSNQMAVQDLLALGRVLLLPEDDLTLAGVLKSPLFGVSEDCLFELAWKRPDARLWHSLQKKAETDEHLADIVAHLRNLMAAVDYLAPYELFQMILNRTVETSGGRKSLVAHLGEEAEEAIDEILAQALIYESTHTPSLQGFLHWLGASEFEVKRELDGAPVDQVRIMTVHGSKGLQAPIVILPDTTRPPQVRDSLLWDRDLERSEAERIPIPLWSSGAKNDEVLANAARNEVKSKAEQEYRRLLYVAMTRAEDRLVVCGWHGKQGPRPDAWHPMIREALADEAAPLSVPGLEEVGDGWLVETEQTKTAKLEGARDAAVADDIAPPPWLHRMASAEPVPPQPLAPVRGEDEDPPVLSPMAERVRFARGTLLHRLLQTLPELPPEDREAAGRRFLARPSHELSVSDIETWLTEALAVLSHPDFGDVFAPGSRAEVPIIGVVGDVVVSRRIDRLRVTETEVLIVDYKTNRPAPTTINAISETYTAQLADYRHLLQKVYPNQRVRCALLWTDGPHLMEVPEEMLNQARGPA
jgi:ATP-dependent helicase/nuclease subunit A